MSLAWLQAGSRGVVNATGRQLDSYVQEVLQSPQVTATQQEVSQPKALQKDLLLLHGPCCLLLDRYHMHKQHINGRKG